MNQMPGNGAAEGHDLGRNRRIFAGPGKACCRDQVEARRKRDEDFSRRRRGASWTGNDDLPEHLQDWRTSRVK